MAPAQEQPGHEGKRRQTDRHDLEPGRPEEPGADPHHDARDGDGDAARREHHSRSGSATGTSTVARMSAITAPVSRPAIAASAVTITRWPRTCGASALTSSGITKSRRSAAAYARAARSSMIDARGLAPRYTSA